MGCAPQAGRAVRAEQAAPEPPAAEAGYLVTPEILTAERRADGGVDLLGRAAPRSRVRLASPEGDGFEAAAGPDGGWSLRLPPLQQARMFAVVADQGGRPVHAQGALLALPAPAVPALMLRAGYGALTSARAAGRPSIQAVDYDPAGFAAVAGVAAPRAPIRLSLDGAAAGETRADGYGRFSILAANRPLAPGLHAVAVMSPAGGSEVSVPVSPPQPLALPYRGQREAGGWRIDWTPPGPQGAVQTTWVLDPPGQGA